MTALDELTDADIDRLAEMQRDYLPSSTVSKMGPRYARTFYRFTVRSPLELLLVERDETGTIAAGCVVSLEIESLKRRLLTQTHLILALVRRAPALLKSLISQTHGSSPTGIELVLLFTSDQYRGQGLASRMIDRAEELLRKRGESCYSVRTFDDPSDPTVKFYISRGFERRGTLIENGVQFVYLERKL